MNLLKGAACVKRLRPDLLTRVQALDRPPVLALVRIGERPDDLSYERSAVKRMDGLGICCRQIVFPEDVSEDVFLSAFADLNHDPEVDGILLFRPFPRSLDEQKILSLFDPAKDMDGITPQNQALLYAGQKDGYAPCTAEAALTILKETGMSLSGKKAVIIGRSLVIGRPLSLLLLAENCTVTICHTKTADLAKEAAAADILCVAAGVPRLVESAWVKDGAVVIDVGIHVLADGSLTGDVNADSLADRDVLLTPVPGGVGAMTTLQLAEHVIRAAEKKQKPYN